MHNERTYMKKYFKNISKNLSKYLLRISRLQKSPYTILIKKQQRVLKKTKAALAITYSLVTGSLITNLID